MENESDQQKLPPVEISVAQLEEDTLSSLIREFVLREGTDYGASEVALDTKIQQVRRQIDRGDVKIFFEPETESINLVHKSGLGLR
jgi:uncharacterized protein YheU (UPF0270 family)